MGPSSDKSATRAIIALGSNLPHCNLAGISLLEAAIAALRREGLTPLRASSAWRSPAWPPDNPPQPDFLNAVAEVETGARTPEAVLATLLAVEGRFGRVRGARWAARTLDLDLIDMTGPDGKSLVRDGDPILPHPRAHERAFVLAPLAEMAPGWRHPVLGRTAGELLAAVSDPANAARKDEPVNIDAG